MGLASRGRVAGAVGALAASGLAVHCATPYATDDLSDSGSDATSSTTTSTSPSGTGTSTAPTGTDANGPPPDAGLDATVLPAGEIACAATGTTCKIDEGAMCCDAISGTDSNAARTFNGAVAHCVAVDGGSCGGFVSIGDDFTMTFDQSCARPSDCIGGDVCCVVGATSQFDKILAGFACMLPSDCASAGRTLCVDDKPCTAVQRCLAETDPILMHVYPTFCR